MDAKMSFVKITTLSLLFLSAACSAKKETAISSEERKEVLRSISVFQKKSYCLPNPILDEPDIVPLIQDGYKLSPADQYCIPEPDGTFVPGDYNCVPYKFVDEYDLIYLIENGYHDNGTEYCNNVVDPGNNNGGSTDGGANDGGGNDGGSTNDGANNGGTNSSNNGGDTNSGANDGGANNGGNTDGGSTDAGVNNGSNNGGDNGSTIAGGNDNGGSTDAGSTDAGNNNGSTNSGSNDGGGNDGGTDNGGSTNDGANNGGTNGTNNGDNNSGSNDGGANNGSNNGGANNGGSEEPEIPDWTSPVDRMCSQIRTGKGKYRLEDRQELILKVIKREKVQVSRWKSQMVDTVICENRDTERMKREIVEQRKLSIMDCDLSGHNKKDLLVDLYSPVTAADLPVSRTDFSNVRFFKAGSTTTGYDEISFVHYGGRSNRYGKLSEKLIIITDDNPDRNRNVPREKCDLKASPLIVHVNPDHDRPEAIRLTSIENGVRFDILGLNAEPVPYSPKKIGWLDSDQYMFLVKPDRRGRVTGVDQMFGDNTMGPDGDFAANGFIALAKYDKNKDGVIDIDDSIYSQLRLWKDKNFDGIGTPDEMITLKKAKVKLIDLRYDPGFRERDKYGNETLYKSVIMYEDKSLDLIFDLWFVYKD